LYEDIIADCNALRLSKGALKSIEKTVFSSSMDKGKIWIGRSDSQELSD